MFENVSFGTAVLVSLAAVLVFKTCAWVVSVRMQDTSIVDVTWGPGFVVAAAVAFVFGDAPGVRALLVLSLTATWAARLALHIGGRKRGKGEDPRYTKWRNEHPDTWDRRSLVTVFMLQGGLLWIIALPLQWVVYHGGPDALAWTDYAAVGVFAFGYLFESVADAQLLRHLRSGRGGLMTSGLWRYSRHPNYFGEAVLWWGLWMFTLAVPGGTWTLVGPILITVLVRWVSGVPILERRFAGREGWDEYARATSIFVPMPPRRAPSHVKPS